jgi:hypothetical protein
MNEDFRNRTKKDLVPGIGSKVHILAIGVKKGNRLFIGREEVEL